ncbi:Adhesin BmaC autotransporter [Pandoraea anapnoica]|uniref:Adhesin BmaC autotransporter n=1 Tax=Pandoraea anapnoica TaxID=2508301 RepID=A0A5E5AMJ9_9BURK|nr:Adhesin BmaC autotransporter [Pandoraea iniqua]VVE75001.1 Adhesin BmaC autotransporter [Pandoraea anapnoica]
MHSFQQWLRGKRIVGAMVQGRREHESIARALCIHDGGIAPTLPVSVAPSTLLAPHPVKLICLGVITSLSLASHSAQATCTTSGTTTLCDPNVSTPYTSTIQTGPTTPSGATVDVGTNARVIVGDASAISVGANATINISSGALIQNSAVKNSGLYSTGANTIDVGANSTVNVANGATVLSNGTQGNAETINPEGANVEINNHGTIQATHAAAIWFENTVGTNYVNNFSDGVIAAPGNVIGSSGNGAVIFTNQGQVIGNLVFAGGDDVLHLFTESSISGSINGGGGRNLVTLNGLGSDTMSAGAFKNFQTLIKQDSGTWTLSDTMSGITMTEVQGGTLILSGDNTKYAGKMSVGVVGVLQGSSQNLPPTISDDGLVRFSQTTDGTYTGNIAGSGRIEKSGAATLTLAPSTTVGNTYSGGTLISQGILNFSTDAALGATSGGVSFNGGALQFGTSFDLAGSRLITLEANGGVIDTQGFKTTITQPITGPGGLAKKGSGTLELDGVSSYSGGTTVLAGTLAVGDPSHSSAAISGGGPVIIASGATLGGYGTITGNVTNNGTVAVANAMTAFTGQNAGTFAINGTLTNSGLVQVGSSNTKTTGNTLGVTSYVGNGGTLATNSYLAGDGAPSDLLLIQGGTASGTTTLAVTNAGGPGAQTVQDGIKVIQAINGATTTAGAFSLKGGLIKAGAYSYFLAQGGVSPGTSQNWYLRNTIAPTPAPTNGPDAPVIGPTLAEGTPELPDPPMPGTDPTVLYRPEVALYAEIPSVVRMLGLLQAESFHQRQGEQALLHEGQGALSASWARVWGARAILRKTAPFLQGSMATRSASRLGKTCTRTCARAAIVTISARCSGLLERPAT